MHEKKIKERQHWFLIRRKLLSELVFQLCGLGDAFQCSPRDLACAICGFFEHQPAFVGTPLIGGMEELSVLYHRRVQYEGSVAEPLQTITAILPGSKWGCLLLRMVLQDALGEVTKITRL